MLTAISNEDIDDKVQLAALEERISKTVLKVADQTASQSHQAKMNEFRETCYAIQEIINMKVYRCVSTSLEQYFKKRFSISRAQVYRLYEAGSVIRLLKGFTVIPHKERITRQLKNCAGLNAPVLADLWQRVLDLTMSDEGQIGQLNIEDLWTKLGNTPQTGRKTLRKIKTYARSSKKSSDGGEGTDTDYSAEDGVVNLPRKRSVCEVSPALSPTEGYNLRQKTRVETSSDRYHPSVSNPAPSCTSGLDRDLIDCQDAIQNLIQMGYSVECCVKGDWICPTVWKLTSELEMAVLEVSELDIRKHTRNQGKLNNLLKAALY